MAEARANAFRIIALVCNFCLREQMRIDDIIREVRYTRLIFVKFPRYGGELGRREGRNDPAIWPRNYTFGDLRRRSATDRPPIGRK